jgi:hypothetical protein
MKNSIIKYLKRIHSKIPPQIRVLYLFIIDLTRRLRYYTLPIYLFEGKEKISGNSLKIAYLGWDKRISSYFIKRLLRPNHTVQKKQIIPVWNVLKYFSNDKENCDLVIVEINKLTKKFAVQEKGFLLPRWFEMQIDIEDFNNRIKKSDIKRRIRKHSLSFEKRHTAKDFKLFHQRMFIPYISARHKESAILSDYKYLLRRFKKKGAGLGFIMKDGIPVAGSFTEFKKNKFRMSGMGVLDGREDIMRMGVSGAIYYFEILNCIKKGIKTINIGGTSPIITDGLTQFKLSLGAKAEDLEFFYKQYLWFIPLKNSLLLRNILKSNPFINIIKDSLYLSLFIESSEFENENDFIIYINRNSCNNIKGTNINCFDNPEKIVKWIEKEGYQDIKVLEYNIL